MSNGKSPKERKDWIEKMIEENKINLIKWPELESVEQHKVGGYGIVYKAQWCKKNVALKHMVIEDGKAEFEHKVLVKEVKAFISIKSVTSMPSQTGYENIIQCLDWEAKINIARQTTSGLRFLHENDIIHRDLHTQNVVIKSDKNGIRILITDFGASKALIYNSASSKNVVGHIAFIDPVVLSIQDKKANKQSDIYSLGVVMWEISSNGKKQFEAFADNSPPLLSLRIIQGLREKPVPESTCPYVDLYVKCWDFVPGNRPEIKEVCESIFSDEMITGKQIIIETSEVFLFALKIIYAFVDRKKYFRCFVPILMHSMSFTSLILNMCALKIKETTQQTNRFSTDDNKRFDEFSEDDEDLKDDKTLKEDENLKDDENLKGGENLKEDGNLKEDESLKQIECLREDKHFTEDEILKEDESLKEGENLKADQVDELMSSKVDIQAGDQEPYEESNNIDLNFEKLFSEIALNRPEHITELIAQFPELLQKIKDKYSIL
ncbi:kinase-like protein [Gigaspora margarita]|uniref:Kinase-like protein n=1 Tax=Gigaspora margarita TaxID=4874 RepID=A0A8H3XDY6_GIGMA|nr:kinase-like protein [Gigaspora margarita]